MKLKTKFSIFAAFFVIAVAVGLSALFLVFEARYLVKRGREGQLSLARDAAKICRESVIMDDELFAMNYFNSAAQARGVLYLSFADANGDIRIHTDISRIGTITDESISLAAKADEAVLQYYYNEEGDNISLASMPVMVGEVRLGTVYVGFSEGILRDSINESIAATTRRIVAVTLVMLLTGIAAAFTMARRMIDPIERLAGGARKIGEGALEHRIEVCSQDELGDLAGEFNAMALRLKELDEIKENFVYSLTHDLRSPLSAAMGYLSLLLQGVFDPLTSKQQQTLTDVHSICNRLLSLINDILDYAKIKAGKMEIDPQNSDIREIILGLVKTLEPLGTEKNIELTAEVPAEPVDALVDADKLERLTVNLVSNALKFTPENGSVNVSLRSDGENVTVCVADTGMGIPPDQIHTIFGKFSQLKENQKHSRIKGTGIGLSIAQAIVNAHGGRIWVESELEKGTRFIYTVPVSGPNESDGDRGSI